MRSREGYYGLPANELAESPYEIPLLSALEAEAPPADVAFRTASFLFPTAGVRAETMLYLEAPLSGFHFEIDRQEEGVLGAGQPPLCRQEHERAGHREVQPGVSSEPGARTRSTRPGPATSCSTGRPISRPDRYLVETVVRDALSGATGVKRAVLIVPRPPALAESELTRYCQTSGTAAAATDQLANTPLSLGAQRMVPYLKRRYGRPTGLNTAFYFIVQDVGRCRGDRGPCHFQGRQSDRAHGGEDSSGGRCPGRDPVPGDAPRREPGAGQLRCSGGCPGGRTRRPASRTVFLLE